MDQLVKVASVPYAGTRVYSDKVESENLSRARSISVRETARTFSIIVDNGVLSLR